MVQSVKSEPTTPQKDKHKDLSLLSTMYVKVRLCGGTPVTHSTGRREKRTASACWPASLADQ